MFPNTEHSRGAEATSIPIEAGAPVSDHVQATEPELTLTGLVSGVSALGAYAGQFAWLSLKRINEESTLLRVITHYDVYHDMLMYELQAPQRGYGNLLFTAKLRHIRRLGAPPQDVASATTSGPATTRTSETRRGLVSGYILEA